MAVESANTVGYTTQAITADQWYMVGIQFQEVGSATAAININDLIQLSGVTACGWSNKDTDAPQIQYFDGEGYVLYYYINNGRNADRTPVGHDCWVSGGYIVTDEKPLGEGFWLKFPAASVGANASFTVKGEVKANVATTVNFTANTWKIISNPFPVAIDLSNVITTGIVAGPWSDKDNGAQIQYFDGEGYVLYYYINNGRNADRTPVGHDCWVQGGYLATGENIPAGQAFWLKSPQSGSLTFSL